jgi:hypothetical protein
MLQDDVDNISGEVDHGGFAGFRDVDQFSHAVFTRYLASLCHWKVWNGSTVRRNVVNDG